MLGQGQAFVRTQHQQRGGQRIRIGCGVVDDDTDTDQDTVPDCIDQCPGEDDLVDLNNNGIPDCLERQVAIPTVSTWGLVIFAFLLAISGALLLAWRRM